MSKIDAAIVDACVERVGKKACHALPLLQAVQAEFGYLPEEAIDAWLKKPNAQSQTFGLSRRSTTSFVSNRLDCIS